MARLVVTFSRSDVVIGEVPNALRKPLVLVGQLVPPINHRLRSERHIVEAMCRPALDGDVLQHRRGKREERWLQPRLIDQELLMGQSNTFNVDAEQSMLRRILIEPL